MSQRLKRAIRRQQAIQRSRDVAWIAFVALMPFIFFLAAGFLESMASENGVSIGAVVSGVLAVALSWVAVQVFREALRLGRVLKDPNLMMRLESDPDVMSGIHWSAINPFSSSRD